ncbi:MAG TPA: serine/threonine-protein kinase [Polyangiaceae bacterium]|nr:serine/threonine-protein kinase [Polyangiaceae bacterium]
MKEPRSRRDRPNLPTSGVGREELRASLLKPFLLRLRDERGEPAVRALLSTVGIPQSLVDGDSGWISVAATRRVLAALATALGPDALASRGAWMTHPEVLGAYVRMLRVASSPTDAYRYLAANSAETTRVGTYEMVSVDAARAELSYRPRAEAESDQNDLLLCRARSAELVSVPRIWGLPEAKLSHPSCIVEGADECRYVLNWGGGRAPGIGLGAFLGATVCGGAVSISGSWLAAAIAALVGACFGTALSALSARIAQERAARAFEKNRIGALERGLELHGHFRDAAGELSGVTLGGKYRILRKIGAGGIGAVYAAEHVALGSHVAVKVLRDAAAMDASEIARLRREARVQVSIEHPNVIRVLDLDQLPDGSIYVVMELLQGRSLAARLKSGGPMPAAEGVPLFRQVCRALTAAHQLGIVHRDLKPANVFLCDDRVVKVLDFGMSKFAEAEALTQDGYTLGTPEYMSPEQCIGAPVDARTDLYAFGVLMYEGLTGALPIAGKSRRDFLELHQRAIPPSMCVRRPDLEIPPELDDAVMLCLRKRAAERPASARELDRLLAKVPLGPVLESQPPQSPVKARRSAEGGA